MSVCCECCVLSATSWSLVQRSPTECDVSKKCDRVSSKNEAALAPKGLSSYWKKIVVMEDLLSHLSIHSTQRDVST